MEFLLFPALILLWMLFSAAVVGGAVAAGAWIVWRLLDGWFAKDDCTAPVVPDSVRWRRVPVIGGVAGAAALWLGWIVSALQQKSGTNLLPPESAILSAVPFAVFVTAAAMGVAVVRAFIIDRRARQIQRGH